MSSPKIPYGYRKLADSEIITTGALYLQHDGTFEQECVSSLGRSVATQLMKPHDNLWAAIIRPVTIPEGYVLVGKNEVTKKGDVYLSASGEVQHEVGAFGGSNLGRTPAQLLTSSTSYPAILRPVAVSTSKPASFCPKQLTGLTLEKLMQASAILSHDTNFDIPFVASGIGTGRSSRSTVPSLKKINGVYCRRVKAGEAFKQGDVWDNGASTTLWAAGCVTVHQGDSTPLWRPVVVPAGYRIRELDEVLAVGDLGALINGDVVAVQPDAVEAGDDPIVFGPCTVRDHLRKAGIPDSNPNSRYYADDFVVLTKIETEAEKIERLTKELADLKASTQAKLDELGKRDIEQKQEIARLRTKIAGAKAHLT